MNTTTRPQTEFGAVADTETAADAIKECSGMRCPMPLLHTKMGLKALRCGQVLQVTVTDSAYLRDLQFLLNHGQCELLKQHHSRLDDSITVWLKKLK